MSVLQHNQFAAVITATRGALIAVHENKELRNLARTLGTSKVLRHKLLVHYGMFLNHGHKRQPQSAQRVGKALHKRKAKAAAKPAAKARAKAKAKAKSKAAPN